MLDVEARSSETFHALPGSTAYLISFTASAPLWSVSIGQAVQYYRSGFDDPRGLKIFLFMCLLLNTLQIVSLAYNLYFHLITSRLPINYPLLPTAIRGIPSIILHYILAFMAQSFYALRVWFVSRKKCPLFAIIMVFSAIQLAGGLVTSIRAAVLNVLTIVGSKFVLVTQGVSSIATILCDCIITLSLVYFLKGPYFHPTTRFALHKVILYSINIGLITTIMSILPLVMLLTTPSTLFLWEPFFLPAGQIYINSVLVSLNARRSIRDQMNSYALEGAVLNTVQTYDIDAFARRGTQGEFALVPAPTPGCQGRECSSDFVLESPFIRDAS